MNDQQIQDQAMAIMEATSTEATQITAFTFEREGLVTAILVGIRGGRAVFACPLDIHGLAGCAEMLLTTLTELLQEQKVVSDRLVQGNLAEELAQLEGA